MSRTIKWLAGTFGVLLVVGTVVELVLMLDLLGPAPDVPNDADLPTRLLTLQPFEQSRWPVDLLSTLLFAAGFGVLILLGALLGRIRGGSTGSSLTFGAFAGGGALGAASELVRVGGHDIANAIGYCDCGFKNEEAISRFWGLLLLDGVSGWLLNGASVLLAIGVVIVGRWLGGRQMPAAWTSYSWLVAGVIVLAVVLATGFPQFEYGPYIVAITSGVVIPIWGFWLARSYRDAESTTA